MQAGRFVAGIDGGQSSTIAVVGNADGRVVGRGRSGPADEVFADGGSTRLHDALSGALANALADAGLPPDTRLAAVVAGVSGYAGAARGKSPELPADRVLLMHDAPIAHAGALSGEPGVVVIAGTGSVVYAAGHGCERTFGGWGYLFGDEGSAFWFAREALAAMMRRQDVCGSGGEAQRAWEFFGVSGLREIALAFYAGALSRERLAAFAPVVIESGYFDDLVGRGTERLAQLVATAVMAGAVPTVACVGGMFANRSFAKHFAAALHAGVPGVCIVEPKDEPSGGALLLAYREAAG